MTTNEAKVHCHFYLHCIMDHCILSMNQKEYWRNNGKIGGKISSGTLYKSRIDGFVSTAAGLTRYHRKRNWPEWERIQIASGVYFE